MKETIKKEFQKDKPVLNEAQILAVLAITMKCSDLSNEIRLIKKKEPTREK